MAKISESKERIFDDKVSKVLKENSKLFYEYMEFVYGLKAVWSNGDLERFFNYYSVILHEIYATKVVRDNYQNVDEFIQDAKNIIGDIYTSKEYRNKAFGRTELLFKGYKSWKGLSEDKKENKTEEEIRYYVKMPAIGDFLTRDINSGDYYFGELIDNYELVDNFSRQAFTKEELKSIGSGEFYWKLAKPLEGNILDLWGG